MEGTMDVLHHALPVINMLIFVVGVSSNIGLLLATFLRTPPPLKTYSIMIKFWAFNDLVSVCCDFFVMQRVLVIPGHLLYLSLGPCSLISPRACFIAFTMQLCTEIYSLFVMAASFTFRLWVLYRPLPRNRNVMLLMGILYIPPVLVMGLYTLEQTDEGIVGDILLKNASSYLSEEGALSGFSGLTPPVIFAITFISLTPVPVYAIMLTARHMIISKLREHVTGMSERTRNMHTILVQALTVHAMLPPVAAFAVLLYIILFFDIYRHVVLEKAMFTIAAIPPAFGALCTIYFVDPYRHFITCGLQVKPTISSSIVSSSTMMTNHNAKGAGTQLFQ